MALMVLATAGRPEIAISSGVGCSADFRADFERDAAVVALEDADAVGRVAAAR